MKRIIYVFFAMILINYCNAQMAHDAIYMPKNTICFAATATQSQWNEYWEGALLRDNLNMGTHTTQMYGFMAAAGITNNLNVIVGLPYIKTKTSAGNLIGQSGIQDASAWLKYKFFDKKGFSFHAIVGALVPVGNYVPDFLPMSIGLQSKTATARILARYHHKSGVYLQCHSSFTYRGLVKIDRDGYQANSKIYNTNLVEIPNTTDNRLAIGYFKNAIQIEGFAEQNNCVTGDNIRRNDMPFPSNNMQSTMVGAYAKFQPKNLGINVRYGQCFKGLNMGKATVLSVGILYQIKTKSN